MHVAVLARADVTGGDGGQSAERARRPPRGDGAERAFHEGAGGEQHEPDPHQVGAFWIAVVELEGGRLLVLLVLFVVGLLRLAVRLILLVRILGLVRLLLLAGLDDDLSALSPGRASGSRTRNASTSGSPSGAVSSSDGASASGTWTPRRPISARSSATRSASTWTWTFSMTTETSALPLRACRKNVRWPGWPTVPVTNRSGTPKS